MSSLSLNNKYIAEALSPEQRKAAQEILDKQTGADKRKEDAAAKKERSEVRKEKELELKKANLEIRRRREDRRDKGDKEREQRRADKEKRDALKDKQKGLTKQIADKRKEADASKATAKAVSKPSISTIKKDDGDGTALAKLGTNIAKVGGGTAAGVYNRIQALRKDRQANKLQKKLDATKEKPSKPVEKKKVNETSMENVPSKDKKIIKDRYKNLFKKDLKGSVLNANESMDKKLEQQQKKEAQLKKRVLMTKLRALRSGASDIAASYSPESDVLCEVDGDKNDEKLNKVVDVMKGKNKIEVNPQVKAEAYTVTAADKKGNTPAWKGYKAGKKNVKTGKPLYKAADHVKEHHTKDKDGNVIEHEDATPSSVEEGVIDAVKKGAKRHAKAVQAKKIKDRKAVPYAALAAEHEPEGEMVEDYMSGQTGKIQKRTLAWMRKKGMKGAPGLDAMKEREAEHKARRGVKGVKEEAGCETKKIENKGKKKIDPNKNPVVEAKVDQGRSDYGKATIRNWRHSGPSTVEPAMFDPENKRGKTIDKRRAEHKARRGVKGAKVPTYKKEEYSDWRSDSITIQDADGKDFVEIIDIIKAGSLRKEQKEPKGGDRRPEVKSTKKPKGGDTRPGVQQDPKSKNALQINKIVGTQ
jgi:hypothetical protein